MIVETSHVYNVKTITRLTNNITDTKDRWIGDRDCLLEKSRSEYFKEDMRL